MSGTNDEDEQNDSRPLLDRTLQGLKHDADRFMKELQEQEQRFYKDLEKQSNSGGPFSSFKKFVDGGLSTLSGSWTNLPKHVVEFRDKMQQEQQRMLDEELDISRRWNGSDDTPDYITMELARSSKQEKDDARSATALLMTESLRRNENVSLGRIEALYSDPEDMLGQLDRLAEPFFGMRLERGSRQPWLSVDWFKRNAYSPIRLEAHPDLAGEGSKWRAAFEDLLDATLDKPMSSMERVGLREPYGKPQSTYHGPGLEWMLSLQCRGILPPLLPRFYGSASEHSKRALGKQTLTDIIKQNRSEVPWSNRLSPFDVSLLRKDISDLLSEVATKSTADTEAEPMPFGVGSPDTEQDLYDSPHIYPGLHAPVAQHTRTVFSPLTGDKDDDWEEADYGLWTALHAKNSATVAEIVNAWYDKYGDIDDLVHEPLDEFMRRHAFESHSEWFSTLNEAIRRSDLPDDDFWKQNAHSKETGMLEKLDKAPLQEKWRRRQLMRRGDELVGYPLTWPLCSTEELEEMVERMEQENDNLAEMTGGDKSGARVSTARRLDLEDEDSLEQIKWLEELEQHNKQRLLDARREQDKASQAEIQKPQSSLEMPQVLSALTTTQTTRMPDGTVTTKVVLKRRFADGREETEESLHTSKESNSEQQEKQPEAERPKQKGWFWS
ncbi:hypothetical protein CLAFUW4_07425 [Fulvia fulva]|uniref:Uncharacterized protein n=1 Tax=Passalora fulva TaxID=5499 RepID=A0A9Q8PA38_PASFU|nr:uncharacterized protein CLAFUR5_07555 [Fulvia fulva]KAK4621733.1 hypothetical protein CLAFUR4_07432 [Fulvia fulva]KAK4622625.1 hypothetical protein CLAFUR0_07431 [Fulvia fulva]UJO18681.1 hypothetical protein CLAFUR5_07555 [Fulvia fulva]WPV16182.1 hypothetical protein CLAFUW4_07425 [Fulvia fulva]WPV31079.1 hypothetical protein CLAFUW7_07428 [Fulvia fulva]